MVADRTLVAENAAGTLKLYKTGATEAFPFALLIHVGATELELKVWNLDALVVLAPGAAALAGLEAPAGGE